MLAQLMAVWAVSFGAVPKPPEPVAPESVSVLLAEAAGADASVHAKALVESYNKASAPGAAASLLPEGKGTAFRLPGIGRAVVRVERAPLAGAEAAFRRGITALISDEVLAPHVAQLVIEVVPDAGVARLAVVDALALLGTMTCQLEASAIGVYFAAGRVLQPAKYVLGAARDKLPRGWLWVGFELGGNTSELTFTSIGLAKAGLMELQLVSQRRDVGAAIETFFELITLALTRDNDFPDAHELRRTSGGPLVVRHAEGKDGARVWRVAYAPPRKP